MNDEPKEANPRVGWRRRGTVIFLLVILALVVAFALVRRPGSQEAQQQRTSPQGTIITPGNGSPPAVNPSRPS